MMRAWWVSVVCVVLFVSAAAVARAQEDSPAVAEARRRFDLATAQFEQGAFASALTEWERVYALLEGHPNRAYVVYNMGRASEELGRSAEALQLYERFLAQAGEAAPNRADAQRRASELRVRVGLAGRSVTPGGGAFSPSPIGIAIASVGAAAMIAGGIVGGLALAQDGDARAGCDAASCTPDAYAAIGDAGVMANAADGLLWGGLAVLATGIVLTFALAESGAAASAACTDEGCALFVRGRF